MVLNLSQLIKSCSTETHPAAETESIGLLAYAQLSWFLQSHLDSFILTLDSQPSTGIHPSTGIIPSGSFAWTKELSSVNQDSSIYTGYHDNETFGHLPGLLSGLKAPSRLPGLCKNSFQRVPLTATQLNRRAVIKNAR
jgi:hypothetical protein